MNLKHTFYSNVKNGKLQDNVKVGIAKTLETFEGKRIELIISKVRSKRSKKQNSLWWLYVEILRQDVGYTKDEMHEILKMKFLKKTKVDEKTGQEFEYLGSTTQLTKTEFAEMINELIRWSAENFNIVLPLPSENFELELN